MRGFGFELTSGCGFGSNENGEKFEIFTMERNMVIGPPGPDLHDHEEGGVRPRVGGVFAEELDGVGVHIGRVEGALDGYLAQLLLARARLAAGEEPNYINIIILYHFILLVFIIFYSIISYFIGFYAS